MGISVRGESDIAAATSLFGLTAAALAERDASQPPIGRWFAYDDDTPVGVATAFVRADDRCFLTHRVTAEGAVEPLLRVALGELRGPVHLSVDRDAADRVRQAEALGCRREFESTSFEVPFATALEATVRYARRTRFAIVTADQVDTDALYRLDTELRQDIPGNDGWRGNRRWFDDELNAPEFDREGYRVARDPSTGELVGLCRLWRNPGPPALGMLGVVRPRRSGVVALALLDAALRATSEWGSATFSTHTARPALRRRLTHLGAVETGGFLQLVRP